MPSTDIEAMKAQAFDLQREIAVRQAQLQRLVQEIAQAEQAPDA